MKLSEKLREYGYQTCEHLFAVYNEHEFRDIESHAEALEAVTEVAEETLAWLDDETAAPWPALEDAVVAHRLSIKLGNVLGHLQELSDE